MPLKNRLSQRQRVRTWLQRVKAHDEGLYSHSVRVAELTRRFAAYLDYPKLLRDQLADAALLHDVGKLRIPLDVLQKPSPLTLKEQQLIYHHPEVGVALLIEEGGYNDLILAVVRNHHERLDGSGYPRGLKAPDIADAVRIVTICDVYAAMTEARPYGQRLTSAQAISRMWAKSTRLDLDLVRKFEMMAKWNERWTRM